MALSGAAHWQQHADIVAASGLVNTQLGPGEFLENFAIWAEQIKTTCTVREPYPTVVESPISMDDIARVAAALLVKPEQVHYGQMYPITGPQSLAVLKKLSEVEVDSDHRPRKPPVIQNMVSSDVSIMPKPIR